ncbi:MAG: protein kinase [Deltaproteobacteria bacterium]|nr:protein kinase [Deltaproteobacteria bacterium]
MSPSEYEIVEHIARGGMAEVYRARRKGTAGEASDVCVKKILPHLVEDPNFVRMFINEAMLARRLFSKNIVQVYDLAVAGDQYFIVMEYVPGKDLSDILRQLQADDSSLGASLAIYVTRSIALALHHAHNLGDSEGRALGIIHRDVSPQNVLVSFRGEVKLTDFGIAKAAGSATHTAAGILKGKYGYMSPEQARGERLDRRSDLFCLGIVLYEMLVGERCFVSASDYSVLQLMRHGAVTPPSRIQANIPESLEAVAMRLLAKRPEDRYSDGLELDEALRAVAESEGLVAGPDELAALMRSFSKPNSSGQIVRSESLLLSSVLSSAHRKSTPPQLDGDAPTQVADAVSLRSTGGNGRPAQTQDPAETHFDEVEDASIEASERDQRDKPSDDDQSKVADGNSGSATGAASETPRDPKKSARSPRAVARSEHPSHPSAHPSPSAHERRGSIWSQPPRLASVLFAVACVLAGMLLGVAGNSIWARDADPPRPKVVSIFVESTPKSAQIEFDGEPIEGDSPTLFERPYDERPHEIRLKLPEHEPCLVTVRFDGRALIPVRGRLKPIPQPAKTSTPTTSVAQPDPEPKPEPVADARVISAPSTDDGVEEPRRDRPKTKRRGPHRAGSRSPPVERRKP